MSYHVPGQGPDQFEDLRHYSRDERQQMRSFRRMNHRKPYMKYLILVMDLLLLFVVFRCVSTERTKPRKVVKPAGSAFYRSALIRDDYLYKFRISKPEKEAAWEATVIVSLTNRKPLMLSNDIHFKISGKRGNGTPIFSKNGLFKKTAFFRPFFVAVLQLQRKEVQDSVIFELSIQNGSNQPWQSLQIIKDTN